MTDTEKCDMLINPNGAPYLKTKIRSPNKIMSKYPQSELMKNWSDIYHISLVDMNTNLNANDIHHFNLICHLLYFQLANSLLALNHHYHKKRPEHWINL